MKATLSSASRAAAKASALLWNRKRASRLHRPQLRIRAATHDHLAGVVQEGAWKGHFTGALWDGSGKRCMQRTLFLGLVSFPTFQTEACCRAVFARTSSCDRSPAISSAGAADVAFKTWWASDSDGGKCLHGRCRRCHPEYTHERALVRTQTNQSRTKCDASAWGPKARSKPGRRELDSLWKIDKRFLPVAKFARPQAQQAQRLGRTILPRTTHCVAVVIGHLLAALPLAVGMTRSNKPTRRILRPRLRVNSRWPRSVGNSWLRPRYMPYVHVRRGHTGSVHSCSALLVQRHTQPTHVIIIIWHHYWIATPGHLFAMRLGEAKNPKHGVTRHTFSVVDSSAWLAFTIPSIPNCFGRQFSVRDPTCQTIWLITRSRGTRAGTRLTRANSAVETCATAGVDVDEPNKEA